MDVKLMLTVKCEDCKTEFVPDHIDAGPPDVDRDSDGGRGRMLWVRFVPRCPACRAVGSMLRRAGLGKLAAEL